MVNILVVALVTALLVYTPAANAGGQKEIKQSTLRIAENSFYISDLKYLLKSDDFLNLARKLFDKRGLNTVRVGSANTVKIMNKNRAVGYIEKENFFTNQKQKLKKICLNRGVKDFDYKKILFRAFYSEIIQNDIDRRRIIYMGEEKSYKHIIYETTVKHEGTNIVVASWCIFD